MNNSGFRKFKPNPGRGRGASDNPKNRFEKIQLVPDPGHHEETGDDTEFLRDRSRSLITYTDSPDIGFKASINVYRGCEHGCIYCYARPGHEYLGLSAGLDFESKILVKEEAPQLLRAELLSFRWKPQVLAMSGVTDPYQPVERSLKLTRRCLEVLVEFRNPVAVITKNSLVSRDLDLLSDLASYRAAAVFLSVTTLDSGLSRVMEPRASQPERRLQAIRDLRQAGVPAGVMVAPVIPGLTDHELPSIIEEAFKAGAEFAGYSVLRLPYGVKEIFEKWIGEHFAERKNKVLNRIRSVRGGKLNDPNYGSRMRGEGPFADQVKALFSAACRKAGLNRVRPSLSSASFRRPAGEQISLFS